MKQTFALTILICLVLTSQAQKVYTKNGNISFYSKAPIEDITAMNSQVMSVLDPHTGDLQFSVLIKSFHFRKNLMEVHFNENYLESDKYPRATFKGKITDLFKVNFNVDGSYPVTVSGDMNIHGVSRKINSQGMIIIKSGNISSSSKFNVRVADYNIRIPKVVKNNIAEVVEVNVACNYDQKM